MEQEQQEYPEKIIEANIKGRPVKVRGLEFEIDWDGKKEIVQVRKLAYGERAELIERFTKMEVVNNNPQPKFSYKDMVMNAMVMCLVKAPFPTDYDYIYYELDPVIGEKIYHLIEKFNKLTEDQKKN